MKSKLIIKVIILLAIFSSCRNSPPPIKTFSSKDYKFKFAHLNVENRFNEFVCPNTSGIENSGFAGAKCLDTKCIEDKYDSVFLVHCSLFMPDSSNETILRIAMRKKGFILRRLTERPRKCFEPEDSAKCSCDIILGLMISNEMNWRYEITIRMVADSLAQIGEKSKH